MPKTRREILREIDEMIRAGGGARRLELIAVLLVQAEISSPLVESVPGGSSHYVEANAARLPSLIRPEGTLRVVAAHAALPPRGLFSWPAAPGRWSVNLVADVSDTTAPAEYWIKEVKQALAKGGEWRRALQDRAIAVKRVVHVQLPGGIY